MLKHAANPGPVLPDSPQETADQSLLGHGMSTSAMRPALLSLKLRIWARFGRTTSPLGVDPRITVPDPTKISDSGFDCRDDSRCYHMENPLCCTIRGVIIQFLERKRE
jgi:hypothetical protein